MTGAAAQRWERIQSLFEAVAALPREIRVVHLEAAERDATVRQEVLSLLEHHDEQGALDRIAHELSVLTEGARPSVGAARPENVGPYEVIRTIARGGMGSVFLAERAGAVGPEAVAIKLLRHDLPWTTARRRFLAEQQILSRISHPNIARCLDDGVTAEGLPYFVMEYVEGVPIDEHCDAARLTVGGRLELLVAVCAAVAHAHRHGLVHRDLKAENVLVTPEGSVKLLDFGIAKALVPGVFPAADHQTTKGVHLLTPEYASPEQLTGAPVTMASDVFQLGLLLYRLLTGILPPLLARIPPELLSDEAGAEELRLPSATLRVLRLPSRRFWPGAARPAEVAAARGTTVGKLRRRLAGDLDAITMKSLQLRPELRYASVERLREDLVRHLDGLPLAGDAPPIGSGAVAP